MEKDWDLNIYFVEDYDVDTDETTYSDTLRINPVLWMMDGDISNVEYTNIYIDTTFAETRYLRSQYPEDEYGMDWTDSLHEFVKIAPTRLVSLMTALPDPDTVDINKIESLVG
jgi:hypothetical protein